MTVRAGRFALEGRITLRTSRDGLAAQAGHDLTIEVSRWSGELVIGADLASDWAASLLAGGFMRERPSIWLLEGLLMYLTQAEAETTITAITRLTSQGSWIGMDLLNSATLTSPWTRERLARLAQRGMPWQFGVDDPRAWLAPLQWDAQVTTPEEVGRRLERWPYPPRQPMAAALDLPNAFFVIARREGSAK